MNNSEVTEKLSERFDTLEVNYFVKLTKEKKLEMESYIEFLKVQYAIFSILESQFKSHTMNLDVADCVLDELTDLGVIELQSNLKSIRRYSEYLKMLEYNTALPHIYTNYNLLIYFSKLFKSHVEYSNLYKKLNKKKVEKINSIEVVTHETEMWLSEIDSAFYNVKDSLNELTITIK
jgi:hypothetical protein